MVNILVVHTAAVVEVAIFAYHSFEPKHQMHNNMCVMNKGTMTRLSYNTNNGAGTKWNQYGGTGFILNADMRARVTKDGWGSNPTKLRRWMWTRIGGKDEIATVFVSAYRPCHSPDGIHTVWRQQARYFKENADI